MPRLARALALAVALAPAGASALPILSDFTSTLTEDMPETAPPSAEEERSRSDPSARMVISEIELKGLKRTEPFVVERELLIRQGEAVDWVLFDESIQRLKNTELFHAVEPEFHLKRDGTYRLEIHLRERWTLIPIFQFGGGGGKGYLYLGAYDINVLGRFKELGARYDYFDGTHSGVIWYEDPRFLDKRLSLGVQLASVVRVRDLIREDKTLEGGFTIRRKRVELSSTVELDYRLWAGGGIELDYDGFDDDKLDPNELAANSFFGRSLPGNARSVIAYATVQAGRIDQGAYLVDGLAWTSRIERADSAWGSELSFSRLTSDLRYFDVLEDFPLPETNFGARLGVGWTSARELHHLFYLGGLANVRGFLDGQFRDRAFWQSNVELRVPSIRSSVVVLQHVFFVDAGGVGPTVPSLLSAERAPFAGAGVGIRVISPRIYRFNLRLDLAHGFGPRGEPGFSFGLQQFF